MAAEDEAVDLNRAQVRLWALREALWVPGALPHGSGSLVRGLFPWRRSCEGRQFALAWQVNRGNGCLLFKHLVLQDSQECESKEK